MDYIKLNNDVKIPQLGLGTYLLKPDDAQSSVTSVLGMGYELIDTANAYMNERAVGRGMRESGLPREKVFLETKLWPCFYNSDTAVDETLERLNTPYIDLMILHQPAGDYLAGYEKLETAYKEGKLRAIGISNFNENEIEKLLANCEIVPSLIQVECHPYFPQTKLKKLLAQHDIVLQAWYPLGGRGNSDILDETVVRDLAVKCGKTPAQIIMRWHIQEENIVNPSSKNPTHIADNIDVFDFELMDSDMAAIATLDRGKRLYEHTPEKLAHYITWHPDVENQK